MKTSLVKRPATTLIKKTNAQIESENFSDWLQSIPPLPSGALTFSVPLNLSAWEWFTLAHAAALNKKTIGGVIEFLLEDHKRKDGSFTTSPILDLANEGYVLKVEECSPFALLR